MSEENLTSAKWEEHAVALQQILYESLGDRTFEEYAIDDPLQMECAKIKIAYLKFGERKEPVDKKNADAFDWENLEESENSRISLLEKSYATFYTERERKQAGKTLKKLVQLVRKENAAETKIEIAFIFVVFQRITKTEGESVNQVGVIRMLRRCAENCEGGEQRMDEAWYIDHEDRVYRDWQAYLDNNRLPKMTICYPKNGYYSTKEDGYSQFHPEKPGKVLVAFGNTPETKLSRRIAHIVDHVSTGVVIGSLGIGVAALLSAPISAPILLGATVGSGVAAVYGAGRSTARLVDRKLHEQSINVTDPEARLCWIGIGGATFALSAQAATVLLQEMAQMGYVAGRSAQYTVNGLNAGSLLINGVATGNQAYYIGNRLSRGERVTVFDVMQLSLSVFFFSSSVMTFKTVGGNLSTSKNNEVVLAPSDHHADASASEQTAPAPPHVETGVGENNAMPAFEPATFVDIPTRVIRTLKEIPTRELLQRTVCLTKEVTKAAFGDRDRARNEILAKRARTNSTPDILKHTTTEPSPSQSDDDIVLLKLRKDEMAQLPTPEANLGDQIVANLTANDAFLDMLKLSATDAKDVRRLQVTILDAFNAIENKPLILQLLPIATHFAIDFGCRNAVPEFFQLCNCLAVNFNLQTAKMSPSEKVTQSDIEQQLMRYIQSPDSQIVAEIRQEVWLNFLENANRRMTAKFESGKAAEKFYENYKKVAASRGERPITAGDFMTEVETLFATGQSKKKTLLSLPSSVKKMEYTNANWHGVLYESKENPSEKTINELSYIR